MSSSIGNNIACKQEPSRLNLYQPPQEMKLGSSCKICVTPITNDSPTKYVFFKIVYLFMYPSKNVPFQEKTSELNNYGVVTVGISVQCQLFNYGTKIESNKRMENTKHKIQFLFFYYQPFYYLQFHCWKIILVKCKCIIEWSLA